VFIAGAAAAIRNLLPRSPQRVLDALARFRELTVHEAGRAGRLRNFVARDLAFALLLCVRFLFGKEDNSRKGAGGAKKMALSKI
jgi:hypothetical protein